MNFKETLSYDDVLLEPKLGVLAKREDADISTELFDGVKLDIPIISAPMTSVTGIEMLDQMSINGGIGVFPRFGYTIEELDDVMTRFKPFQATSPRREAIWAIGLDLEWYERIYDFGFRWFCFDVAHAHHEAVGAFLKALPHRDDIMLMAGNVGTVQGARYLAKLGVDAIKVGIGPGAACQTREVTGFGVGQLSAVMDISYWMKIQYPRVRIVADGGIKNSGDIVKALAAGADTVMLGKLLASADEAPGKGEYYGMASKRINGHHAPEGAEGKVELVGPLKNVLKQLTWGLRSGISYAGATNLKELRQNACWQRVAPGVHLESSVRL